MHDFCVALAKAEADLLTRKRLFEEEGQGISDHLFESVEFDWKGLDFPDILGIRSYPRLAALMKILRRGWTPRGNWHSIFKLPR